MPRYLDVHRNLNGVTLSDVQAAHEKDLKTQSKQGVKFIKYWVDQKAGAVFCLSEAPNKEAPMKVHAEAHGLLPDETYEVQEGG
jgi:Nickel responsive protein SCO4226-like